MTKIQTEIRHLEHKVAEAWRNGNMPLYYKLANELYRLELASKGLRHPGRRNDWRVNRL